MNKIRNTLSVNNQLYILAQIFLASEFAVGFFFCFNFDSSFFVQAGQQVREKSQGAVEGVKNATGMNK